ncbi:MAG TPA: cache domain-containing protein [Anaerolineae bacterium]
MAEYAAETRAAPATGRGSGWWLRRPPSLLQQFILVVVLPLTVLSVAVGLLGAYEVRQVSLNLVLERHTALAAGAAAGVSAELNGYLQPLQAAAQAIGASAGSPSAAADVLRTAAPYLARFDGGVALLNEDGDAIATTPDHPERLGHNYAFREYFQRVRQAQQPVFSAVLAEQPSGQPAVVIAVPVAGTQGTSGVLLGALFLARHPWQAELGPLTTGAARQVYLVDASGTVIYHPDLTQAGGRLTDPGALALVATGRAGSRLQNSALLGKMAVIAFAPLSGAGWGLIIEEPWDAILAASYPWQWVIGGLLLLAVLAAPVIALAGARRVTQPLLQLAAEARRVAGGAALTPLPPQGARELRTMIDLFNQMVSGQQEQQAMVRGFAIQVVQSQEEERKRLARELHDETVQQLIGLVQRIELCRTEIVRDPAAARRRLDELQGLARQAVAGLRQISNDLRPLLLEEAGLAMAVQTLGDELGRGLPAAHVHCEIVGDPRRLPAEVELTVFRIVQEALTNVRRHAASAGHINITLYYEAWGLLATIEDDGQGFSVETARNLMQAGHLGLAGMHERARLIGAAITIDSTPGAGTTITLRVPNIGEPRPQSERPL